MAEAADAPTDPVVVWMLRYPTRLKPGGPPGEHEVLATYRTAAGTAPFALCRDGLLIDPYGATRFIRYVEIEDAGYHNREMGQRAKRARRAGASEPLTIRLESGETIELPVEVRDDGMPDLLTIARILERRSLLFRRERERSRQEPMG